MTAPNDLAVRQAFEAAGVEFIDENGGGPGVRLRKRQEKKASSRAALLVHVRGIAETILSKTARGQKQFRCGV